jgi:hypothetical protein
MRPPSGAKWRDHFGISDDETLIVQGASEGFNPTLNAGMIARAKAADPEAAESEWGGGFRTDISSFLSDELIEAAIDYARPLELPPKPDHQYQAFVDASGGRHDHYVIGIAHCEGERCVADVVRGYEPPFDPGEVTREFATLVKDYKVDEVKGDAYAAAWVEEAWRNCGIGYERCEQNKSALYLESLPLWTRGLISIPDHKRLLRELRLLERRTSRIGRDIVDHGRSGSDDYANALCGVLVQLSTGGSYDSSLDWVGGPSQKLTNSIPHLVNPIGPMIANYLKRIW